MENQEKKLTVVEASKICGVTRSTVWRWIKSGQLDAGITAGGHHRIDESVLSEFMDEKNMHTADRRETNNRVLIVDDDASIQKYFRRLLSKENYELFFASDGFEAGINVYKHKPALVILDLIMPKMDGFKVCEQIKNDPETSRIKVIAISGHDSEENKKKILEKGADTFCSKPFDTDMILIEIKRFV